jgi:hypothetical protein
MFASSPVLNNNITISSKSQDQKAPMNIQIEVSEDPISLGREQTITVTAFDTVTDEPIEYADIDGIVTYPSGETKEFDDDDGIISLTWEIESDSEAGVFNIDITASAAGYEEITKSRTFEVIQEQDKEDKQDNEEEEEDE